MYLKTPMDKWPPNLVETEQALMRVSRARMDLSYWRKNTSRAAFVINANMFDPATLSALKAASMAQEQVVLVWIGPFDAALRIRRNGLILSLTCPESLKEY